MFKTIKKLSAILLVALFIGMTIGIYGCGNTTTAPQTNNLQVSTISSRGITDNVTDVLILDTVKVLIKNIKLNGSGHSDSTNFKVGPYVFYLNFAPLITSVNTAFIPPGTYDKIIFDFHKLEDTETPLDPDFLDFNGRYSTVVKGTFNGTAFVFKSDKSFHQILHFPGDLTLTTTGLSNVTIFAQPYIWFYKNGVVMNPNDSANRNDIENNIKDNVNNNFKAFRDDNKDGQPD